MENENKSAKSEEENPILSNPTARDFQRTEEDIDSVSQSEKDMKEENREREKDYNPTARDFQRTEQDIDSVSESEQETEEEKNKRTERGNTKPDKNKMA